MSIPFASVSTSSDDKHAFWAFVRSAADTAGRQALREGGRAHVQVLRVRFDRARQGRRASPPATRAHLLETDQVRVLGGLVVLGAAQDQRFELHVGCLNEMKVLIFPHGTG